MTAFPLDPASIVTFLSTELNSLGNGSAALGAAYDNGNASNLYQFLNGLELNVTFGSSPTNGNLINLYLVFALDGTNYADNASNAPMYLGGFVLVNDTSAHRYPFISPGGVLLIPPVPFKIRAVNNSGVSFPASGSTIKGIVSRNKQV